MTRLLSDLQLLARATAPAANEVLFSSTRHPSFLVRRVRCSAGRTRSNSSLPLKCRFVAALAASSAAVHDFKVGALDISHPWSHPTTNGVTVAGGYLTITKHGGDAGLADRGHIAPAGRIEMYELADVDGLLKTRRLVDDLERRQRFHSIVKL